MEIRRHKPRRTTVNATLNIALLTVVALLLVFSVFLVRAKLLQNAQTFGQTLAYSYAIEEERNIETFKRYALLASQYIDEIAASGGNKKDVQTWLQGYFAKLTGIIGENKVDPYAVIDGYIVAANPWEGDDDYQYTATKWYTDAIDAGGELVCGEVYYDAITGQRILTISKELTQPGDVFALDIYIQNPAVHNDSLSLPDSSSFYLCDQDGQLLRWDDIWDTALESAQRRADYLLAGIRDGSLLAYDTSFTDQDGNERGVYYYVMSNGWTVILTMPLNSILMGDRSIVIYIIAAIAVLLFAALAFLTLRDIAQNRRVKRADDTAHMLGDSFYAIFRVNFRQGVYEAIKVYPDIHGILPRRGDYSLVLNAIRPLVKSSTYQAFEQSFSLESICKRVMQGMPDYGGDYQRKFDGVYRWVNIRTLYDAKVAPDEVILCFRDVDEEKRREFDHLSLLQDALDAATASTRARSEFFSRMSHDMRTPLNAIIGSCELARQARTASDQGKVWSYLEKIEFAGRQLLELINDILELSRMEAGKDSLDEREFDLKQLFQNIAGMFRDLAARESKTFEPKLDFADVTILGDSQKIVQIVNNLLSNAFKYSEPGATIRLEVKQFSAQAQGKYTIQVEDNGIGMSPEFLEHLFDPYTRETVFTKRSRTGTGLGMPIVKNLVHQMGGEISVESKLGQGSRFTITLPLNVVHSKSPSADAPQFDGCAAKAFDWEERTVLVAEDNEINMDIITAMLETLGVHVLCAADGAEAVDKFAQSSPGTIDAILMDMQMPVMDGCQAAAAIRALNRPDASLVPIIAVTANAYAEDIARTARSGMNDHISKPIDMALLTKTLEKLICEAQHLAPGGIT